MKINSVKFKSFRQHRDVEFDFSGDHGDLVIIKGNNGAGKTTFLNGVMWCLYGIVDGSQKFSPDSLLSQSDIRATKTGEEIVTEVTIALTLGDGANATVTRRIFFARVDEGVKVVKLELDVLAREEISAGYVRQSEPAEWIESKLPTRFSPYFLFDGERLDRFFRESDARFIKDSVLQIAQVDVLGQTIRHLTTLSEELTRDAAKNLGSEGATLAADYERVCSRIVEMEKNYQDADAQVHEATELVEQAQGRLGDIAAVVELMEQRKQVLEYHHDASVRFQSFEDDLGAWALQAGPSALLRGMLENLRAEIDSARREQVLPPPFDPAALVALIEVGECICGRELTTSSDATACIEHIVSKYEAISEVGDALSRLEGPLFSGLSTVSRGKTTSTAILDRLKEAKDEVSSTHLKWEQLNQRLAGHDDAQVALLHDQLRKAEKSKETYIDSRARFSSELIHLKQDQSIMEKKISSQKTLSVKAAEALRKSTFSLSTLKLAKIVYDQLSDSVRDDVAFSLDQQFKKMIWKKDFIDEVGIDENFRVSVINNTGFEILSELSAGERICLAFAYSLTLGSVAGIRFPLVVDSPMGKLGPEVQNNLAGILATETSPKSGQSDQQLILLMTDTEYTNSVARILAARDPLVFSIDFNVAVSETSLVRELN
jgi:DNA sulfur modification protein DndD